MANRDLTNLERVTGVQPYVTTHPSRGEFEALKDRVAELEESLDKLGEKPGARARDESLTELTRLSQELPGGYR